MAIASMVLDPNAAAYTDDEIVGKINSASATITRASCVSAAARPIADAEVTEAKIDSNAVTNAKLASSAAKDNLDALSDTARGYIKTSPTSGEFKVVNIQRDSDGKLDIDYDDVAV